MVLSKINPIILYSHASGPNPWKISILLEELGLPYETRFKEFPELKVEPYITLNPNGRVPAIEDRNTGVSLAESAAIIQYLIDTYDTEGRFTYQKNSEAYYKTLQWLAFQVSGQGPYFGQKAWFSNYHSEKLPSAEKRYGDEIRRVVGVIDAHLKKQHTDYLVGNKVTFADLSFITWTALTGWLTPDLNLKEFPAFEAWNQRLVERPAVKKVLEEKAKKMAS